MMYKYKGRHTRIVLGEPLPKNQMSEEKKKEKEEKKAPSEVAKKAAEGTEKPKKTAVDAEK